jgi:hypothetical protein
MEWNPFLFQREKGGSASKGTRLSDLLTMSFMLLAPLAHQGSLAADLGYDRGTIQDALTITKC